MKSLETGRFSPSIFETLASVFRRTSVRSIFRIFRVARDRSSAAIGPWRRRRWGVARGQPKGHLQSAERGRGGGCLSEVRRQRRDVVVAVNRVTLVSRNRLSSTIAEHRSIVDFRVHGAHRRPSSRRLTPARDCQLIGQSVSASSTRFESDPRRVRATIAAERSRRVRG